MQNPFIINQRLSLKEYFKLTLYFFLSQKIILRFFLFLFLLIGLSTFLGVVTTSENLNIGSLLKGLFPIIVMFVLLIAFIFTYCLWLYKSKSYFFQNVSYSFTDWGMIRQDEKMKLSKSWGDISKVKETKSYFLLYVGKMDFHIIQKEMFNTENETDSFRKMLESNMAL